MKKTKQYFTMYEEATVNACTIKLEIYNYRLCKNSCFEYKIYTKFLKISNRTQKVLSKSKPFDFYICSTDVGGLFVNKENLKIEIKNQVFSQFLKFIFK